MDVILIEGARDADRPVADANLDAPIVPGRLAAGGAAGGRVLREGPFPAASEGQLDAVEVVLIVRGDRQEIGAAAGDGRLDIGAVGEGAPGEAAIGLGLIGDAER